MKTSFSLTISIPAAQEVFADLIVLNVVFTLSKRLKVAQHYHSVKICITFKKFCQTCFLYCELWCKKMLRASSNEDENVSNCNREHALATQFVCMCGMQTGSQDRANTRNKSQHFSRHLKSPTRFISFSS